MSTPERLSDEQQSLAEDYHDTAWNWQLLSMLGDQKELDRLNTHRDTSMTQDDLDAVLREALRLRGYW